MATHETFSLRAAEKTYRVSRVRLRQAIRSGELVGPRPGIREFKLLRVDIEKWLRSTAVKPANDTEARVERLLDRENAADPPATA